MIFGELGDRAVFARWQKKIVRGTTHLPATDLGILYQVDGITKYCARNETKNMNVVM